MENGFAVRCNSLCPGANRVGCLALVAGFFIKRVGWRDEQAPHHQSLVTELSKTHGEIAEAEAAAAKATTDTERQRLNRKLEMLKIDQEVIERHIAKALDAPPDNYEKDGQEYCGLHNIPLSGTYRVRFGFFSPPNFGSDQYPNAKFNEARGDEEFTFASTFCLECQRVLDELEQDEDEEF